MYGRGLLATPRASNAHVSVGALCITCERCPQRRGAAGWCAGGVRGPGAGAGRGAGGGAGPEGAQGGGGRQRTAQGQRGGAAAGGCGVGIAHVPVCICAPMSGRRMAAPVCTHNRMVAHRAPLPSNAQQGWSGHREQRDESNARPCVTPLLAPMAPPRSLTPSRSPSSTRWAASGRRR